MCTSNYVINKCTFTSLKNLQNVERYKNPDNVQVTIVYLHFELYCLSTY